MKKALAIILSIVMLIGLTPVSGIAADEGAYERYKVSGGDAEYIESLSAEQMAAVILDWVDRQVAAAAADFETFEVDVMGTTVAVDIPEIAGVDDIVAYSDYLANLEGDFANLDTTNLSSLSRENGNLEFIYGVLQFMADNADVFGKVFHWEEGKVFDYGKVGEYIEGLDTTDADNKKIVDFYNDYLIGNNIQSKFIDEIAGEMGYTYAVDENGERAETFDEIISNGIITWFSGLCEEAGVLSADGLDALKAYDLRTTDIYTLVKNFVALVQSDNQVKLDTYYNYLLDTTVRTLLKTMLGQTPAVGAEATVPAGFAEVYTDLDLLEEISGGTAYYKDGESYYQITVKDGAATANVLTWTENINLEPPTVGVYTGATDSADRVISSKSCDLVQTYMPSADYSLAIYSSYADQINDQLPASPIEGLEINVTSEAIPEEITAVMIDDNAKAMKDLFAFTVDQGDEALLEQVITFEAIETLAETKGLEAANSIAASMKGTTMTLPFIGEVSITDVTISDIDVVLSYNGYATADEFICQVTSAATGDVTLVLSNGMTIPADNFDASSYINNPVATIVLDGLSGSLEIGDAQALLDFVDTDFDIDADLLDIAGNYDAYDGAIGQVNHILYGLVDMLVSDSGMAELDLVDGDNNNLTANLQKICDTANSMMEAAEKVMNDEGLQDILGTLDLDISQLLGDLDLDLIYAIDFSSVEALYVSAITMGLDIIDDGTNELIGDIHAAIGDLENLDAMAVAMTDYLLGKCIPDANEALGCALTVPAKTDAAAVADGAGKDIIMDKLVDVALEAITWAVDDLLNGIANDLIASLNDETGADLPEIAFSFGVEAGADWEVTLTAIVDRIYELADGIIIACDNDYTDVFDKISAVANAILPLGSLASNCASDDFAFDVDTVLNTYIFADGLNGDLDGLLGLFETKVKTEDVAADVPVTKALINASQHIVDSIFPGTVVADNYAASLTVKEEFTSGDNDVVIAANNMRSINSRKADLVPAALNLVREAGILPYFAACDHTGETKIVKGTPATCSEEGVEDAVVCAECGYTISGGGKTEKLDHSFGEWQISTAAGCTTAGLKIRYCSCGISQTEAISATGHSFGAWTVTTPATCEADGVETRTCSCGASETRAIAAIGHADANGDEVCDNCGEDLSTPSSGIQGFFDQIKAFFQSIIDWFKNLFK